MDKKLCLPDACSNREKLTISGRCERCPEYWGRMKRDFKKCFQKNCPENELLSIADGQCYMECPKMTRPIQFNGSTRCT